MAITITRTAWIDDDGTGTTGTVINNAVKTGLYNEIDGALAKAAQLAGGNAFTGAQSVAGVFTVTQGATVRFMVAAAAAGEILINSVAFGGGRVCVGCDQAIHPNGINIQNTSTGNGLGYVAFYNSVPAVAGYILQTGASTVSYVTSSDARLKHDHGRAADLTALRGVVVHDFTWIADGIYDRGVFAQEAHALYPRAVSVGTDETTEAGALARPWMTDYSKFVPDLIVGWQQHDAELAELRALLTTEGP